MNPHRKRAYINLLLVTLIWGAASVVIKLTLGGIDPLPFLTYRLLISAAIGFLILRKSFFAFFKRPIKEIAALILYALMSTTFALGFLFLGLDKTTVLNLALITLVVPLLIEYAGVIFLKERITKREKIGSFIAFGGTLLTVVEPILENGAHLGELEGNILILMYVFVDVASVIILKLLLRKHVEPASLTHFSFIIGLASLVPFVIIFNGMTILTTIVTLPFQYHLGVWYMAVLSGTVAYTLRARAQRTIEVSEGALFIYINPIIATLLALAFLNERITLPFVVGATIIAFGVFIAETKPKKQL